MLIDVTQKLVLRNGAEGPVLRDVFDQVLSNTPPGEMPSEESSKECGRIADLIWSEPVVELGLKESAFIMDRVWKMVQPMFANPINRILEGSRLDAIEPSSNGHGPVAALAGGEPNGDG